jgi:serine/threonine protein kinase
VLCCDVLCSPVLSCSLLCSAVLGCVRCFLYGSFLGHALMPCTIALLFTTCQGLRELHARHLVHLDIKLDNVFVTSGGCVKIGDMGLCRSFLHGDASPRKPVSTPINFRGPVPEAVSAPSRFVTSRLPFVPGGSGGGGAFLSSAAGGAPARHGHGFDDRRVPTPHSVSMPALAESLLDRGDDAVSVCMCACDMLATVFWAIALATG